MTERSNDLYPKSYGSWAGDPKGHQPDYSRCCQEVWSNERWSRHSQCQRKRGHGPDGAYCRQHDPEVVKARRAASDARYKAEFNEKRYGWHGKTFFDALQLIADGHNDARGLARETIDKFKEGER